ncbi:hypothetical protein C8R45DRAFT_943725 [Mycena sanguinolenta]|nr:hypothetical protein C8R45DRAFT_943725 [Mycena sanguinolenta]
MCDGAALRVCVRTGSIQFMAESRRVVRVRYVNHRVGCRLRVCVCARVAFCVFCVALRSLSDVRARDLETTSVSYTPHKTQLTYSPHSQPPARSSITNWKPPSTSRDLPPQWDGAVEWLGYGASSRPTGLRRRFLTWGEGRRRLRCSMSVGYKESEHIFGVLLVCYIILCVEFEAGTSQGKDGGRGPGHPRGYSGMGRVVAGTDGGDSTIATGGANAAADGV